MSRALALVLCGVAVDAWAAERWANGIDGVGRIGITAGWKLTPNDWFFARAAESGYPTVSRGFGGPQATASFGYGAISWLEVAIDLFIGHDRVQIEGFSPVTTLTYGALVGVRATFMDRPVRGLAPFLGIGVGPTLGYVFSGQDGQTFERLVTGVAGTAGLSYRLTDRFGLTLEYRFLLARGVWLTSGINVGGHFLSLGAVIYFAREPSDASRVM